MKLTNNFNLPDTFVNVIKRPQYSKGDSQISATEILNSPRIVQLKRKHWDQLTEDASDMVWSLFGSAVHNILQHGQDENHVVEERLFTTFDSWRISGAIDLQTFQSDGSVVISDYKVTSAWAVQQQKTEWVDQLNLYAWLVERVKAHPVIGLQIIGIVRDWSRREAALKDTYPQAPIVTLTIPLWDFETRERFVKDRLTLHNEANFAAISGQMPECTPEEMWEKPTTYAIMKDGGVRAKKVCTTEEEAESLIRTKFPGHKIEVREGGRTRCEGFCQAAPFCEQYQRYQREKS